MTSQERIQKLRKQIDAFYAAYPHPDPEEMPEEGILQYTRMARPLVTQLRKGDLELARFITYGLPYDRDPFLAMFDFYIKAGAHALCGAAGGDDDWLEAAKAVDNYIARLDDGGDGFPLTLRWREMGIDPGYKMSEKWGSMMYFNICRRLKYYPE